MDGALNIKERIIEDANQEADRIIEDGRAKADELIDEKKREAQKIREKILKKNTEQGGEQRRRMLSAAHMDIKKRELEVKLELIDDAFSHVLEKVEAMSDQEYDDFIFKMLLGSSLKGDEEIIFPKEPGRIPDRGIIDRLNASLESAGKMGNIKTSDRDGDFRFGFIISSEGVEMNNSLEAILAILRDEIEPKVATILFEDKSGE